MTQTTNQTKDLIAKNRQKKPHSPLNRRAFLSHSSKLFALSAFSQIALNSAFAAGNPIENSPAQSIKNPTNETYPQIIAHKKPQNLSNKVAVLGGSGHIGTYLVPLLVENGYEVVNITRGKGKPYISNPAWSKVKQITLDRNAPNFAREVAKLNADIVIDLICFTLKDTRDIVEALRKTSLSHYLFCSSIWAHGFARSIPIDPNDTQKEPLDEYGLEKFKSEMYLKEQHRQNGFPATIIMPGQICGEGYLIISPYGNTDTKVYEKIARGEEICLPHFGMESLHHIHAKDVAMAFFKAITHRNVALGESFHAVSKQSITTYGYARFVYEFFNQTPKIKFLSWEAWSAYMGDKEKAQHSYFHLARSGHYSLENATRLIEFAPQYEIKEVLEICLKSYIARGVIKV